MFCISLGKYASIVTSVEAVVVLTASAAEGMLYVAVVGTAVAAAAAAVDDADAAIGMGVLDGAVAAEVVFGFTFFFATGVYRSNTDITAFVSARMTFFGAWPSNASASSHLSPCLFSSDTSLKCFCVCSNKATVSAGSSNTAVEWLTVAAAAAGAFRFLGAMSKVQYGAVVNNERTSGVKYICDETRT